MEQIKVNDCHLREALSCEKSDKVIDVAKKLRDNKERHIIVTDSGNPIGIISTTDMNNRVVAENKNSEEVKADEIMTSPIKICEINESLSKAYFEMLRDNVYSCPVIENGKLRGVLDLKEAMNHLVKSQVGE